MGKAETDDPDLTWYFYIYAFWRDFFRKTLRYGKTGFQGKIHVVDIENILKAQFFYKELDPLRIVGEREFILNTMISIGNDLLLNESKSARFAIMLANVQ